MADLVPQKEWWTAAEIAEARLPDLPTSKRRVASHAERNCWASQRDLVRRRRGRGGGVEYHWTLLPTRAQAKLLTEALPDEIMPAPKADRSEAWAEFEGLTDSAKQKARHRLEVIDMVEAIERGGIGRDTAVRDAARIMKVSHRTIWNWLGLIEGVRADDRLPFLAPRHQLAARKTSAVSVDPEFLDLVKADYLRPEQPTMTSVYDRVARIAASKGLKAPPLHTVRRRFADEVSDETILLRRKGLDALKAAYPPQTRSRAELHAMEAVNGDFHRFDVFVRFPASGGQPEEICRPQMVAFQDIFSGRLLSHRVDRTPNSRAVQLCLGDMIERWGIPERVLLDNGREFAAKLITGGAPTRYRFKALEDDLPGLLVTLGCKIHWATPYSGQSKPIERAFRDLCDRVAKHPAFAGAYTGNKPDAKPENYGDRAIDLDDFLAVLSEELTHHNLRPDRRTEIAYGRSFAEVFDESYKSAPIRKATEAQRRLWLMGAKGIRPNAKTGQITFMDNDYHADWLFAHRGQKLVARFDPNDLWSGLHLYALDGGYLGHAPCMAKVGFFDVDEGRARLKARRQWIKAEKAAAEAHIKYTAAEIGDALAAAPTSALEEPPEAAVVQIIPTAAKTTGRKPQSDAELEAEIEATRAALEAGTVADLSARREDSNALEDDPRALHATAMDIEARMAAGEAVTRDERRWLSSYQSTPSYQTWTDLVATHGDEVLNR